MIVCPSCGEENPDRARFCLACGHEFATETPAGEERKLVSVLFVDLVGFTGRSDRADPEDVRATLRPYHERVKADIERFGGTVEKFIGDAVMAVFGAPVVHEDDAERAVRSGLRILDTIDELREEGLDLAVRAAVTTGEAVVTIGARPERGEGIATGDVVNTAARLQSAAPVGSVLVDETTMRATRAAITFAAHEPVAAKGKVDPIHVWRAVEARSRVGQPEAATRAPFIGREHERSLLLETFLRSERESSVQLVTVVGEPGIGKSRLVTELRTALDERPEIITWRHGRCLPYGDGITFWALGEIVKAEAGILESDTQTDAASKLASCVAGLFSDDTERSWFSARLAPLVGIGGDDANAGREETFTAWRRVLEAMAVRRPCVFVVEDLHWADESLLEFLEHLLDWSTGVPLLLLCTTRPELYERQPSWGGGKRNATTISLSPLSTEDSARLLHALLDRTVLPAETQAMLLDRAGGNPLYAEQFARMLAERDAVDEVPVPETVQALVAARIDTLAPELKALLHAASVVGRVFWSGALASIESRGRDEVLRLLNELVRREFVRPIRVTSIDGEEEFSFWHALVRDVAYQQIPRARRAETHLAAAAWVEDTAADRVADHAEILVHHYGHALELAQAAGDAREEIRERLVQFLLLAGDRAAQLDTAAAENTYRRALDLTEADQMTYAVALERLGRVLFVRGDSDLGVEAVERALPVLLAHDRRAAGAAMSRLGTALWARGEPARATALDEEALSILESSPSSPELVRAYGSVAMREAIGGRPESAKPLIEKGLALAHELGVEDVVHLLQARAAARHQDGDPRAVDDNREARDLALRLGMSREAAVLTNNLADATLSYVGVRAAREIWDDGIRFCDERGLLGPGTWQRGERLRCLYHEGEWDALLPEAEAVLEWTRERGAGPLEGFARIPLASVYVHRGLVSEAQAQIESLLPRAREIGDPQSLVPALAAAAVVASTTGDVSRALELVSELERITVDEPAWRALCLVWPVSIAAAAGELRLAEAFLEGAEVHSAWAKGAHATALATISFARNLVDESAVHFREAVVRWDEWGSVVERAYALVGLGRCGDAGALREGHAIFERLGASPLAAQAA